MKIALSSKSIGYQENFPTSKLSSIKAGGNAKIAIFPSSTDQLIEAITICEEYSVPYKIIGGCTNTCFADIGFNGAVILTKRINRVSVSGDIMNAECGSSLSYTQRLLSESSLAFVPELFGIPGSIGGALRNNAGAFSNEISSAFLYGEFFDLEKREKLVLSKTDLSFSYRYSSICEKLIFLSGSFKVLLNDKYDIKRIHADTVSKRRLLHPNEPSLGSFFKRTDSGISAAKFIDSAGLKGYSVGGAAISDKHAGFIVNSGNASINDIEALALYTEHLVKDLYGIILEREAEIVLPKEF